MIHAKQAVLEEFLACRRNNPSPLAFFVNGKMVRVAFECRPNGAFTQKHFVIVAIGIQADVKIVSGSATTATPLLVTQ